MQSWSTIQNRIKGYLILLVYCIILLNLTSCEKNKDFQDTGLINVKKITTDELKAVNVNASSFSADSISIYPNPFQTKTYVSIRGLNNDLVEIKVSGDNGMFRTRYKQIGVGTVFLEMDFTNVPKGSYLCDIIAGNEIVRSELLKLKN